MEEDQEARYHGASPWENQGSLATGETKQGDGSEGLCMKMEGAAAALETNEHHSCICHICNKGFGSGKALGGHMRIHNTKQIRKANQGAGVAKSKTNKWVLVSGNPTCYLCKRSFFSMKSLFGHMKSHPERVRKGIQVQPHNNTPNNNGASSSNSTSSSTLSVDCAADLSQALRGWSVTAKRGRRSLSCCNAKSSLEHHGIEVEQGMQEAVYELMLLASGNPKWKEMVAGDQVDLPSISLTKNKKFKIEDKLNKMGYGEDLLKSAFQNSDGSTVFKNKKGTKKKKLAEIETAEQGNKLDRWCPMFNKAFPSHQTPEGHLSSHKKAKNIQINEIMDESESESDEVSATKEEHHAKKTDMQVDEIGTALGCCTEEAMRGHQCKIFNKTFATGHVFGDHKRSDWTGMVEALSAKATSPVENGQNCSKIFSFDLNQPPSMNEEEGVQS